VLSAWSSASDSHLPENSKSKPLLIELSFRDCFGDRHILGRWRFDSAAFPDRENEELRQSTTTLTSSAVLFFRLVIKRSRKPLQGDDFHGLKQESQFDTADQFSMTTSGGEAAEPPAQINEDEAEPDNVSDLHSWFSMDNVEREPDLGRAK
jgi:hypothetical protein